MELKIINTKEEILKLRKKGKSYNDIAQKLGCSKGTISYHCGDGQKEKTRNRHRKSRNTPGGAVRQKLSRYLKRKVYDYKRGGHNNRGSVINGYVGKERFINKIINNPVCYITGDIIDLTKPSTYNLDHKIPLSRGGRHSLNNFGLTTKRANMSKYDMTIEELIEFCIKTLEYRGYKIMRDGGSGNPAGS